MAVRAIGVFHFEPVAGFCGFGDRAVILTGRFSSWCYRVVRHRWIMFGGFLMASVAEDRINHAMSTGAHRLDLSCLGLDSLPSLGNLTSHH
jgi:hypothetical protein